MKLLTDRFPFVAVSIAFAVNKQVSEKKEKVLLSVTEMYPHLDIES